MLSVTDTTCGLPALLPVAGDRIRADCCERNPNSGSEQPANRPRRVAAVGQCRRGAEFDRLQSLRRSQLSLRFAERRRPARTPADFTAR